MRALILTISLMTASMPALAYVGPGLGLGAIGILLALVVSIVLALIGLLWYPLKRRFSKRSKKTEAQEGGTDVDGA